MKLATYQDGSRDGQLVVVSRDLATAHYASAIASRLQQVLDDWNFMSPQLEELSQALNHGKARHAFAFDPRRCMAPLPRAFQRVDTIAFVNHLRLQHQVADTSPAATLDTEPVMHRAASDALLGACDDIVAEHVDEGIDFGAGLAVITGDVAFGATQDTALEAIRLVMLVNDVNRRERMSPERANAFGPLSAKPATAFSPVAATPDEFGTAWRHGRLHLNLETLLNGKRIGLCDAGSPMSFHFGQLIAHLCKAGAVGAGSIVGSGPVSGTDATRGSACIADKRALETLESGMPKTPYMQFGDTVHIDMKNGDGMSVFGTITQRLIPRHAPESASLP